VLEASPVLLEARGFGIGSGRNGGRPEGDRRSGRRGGQTPRGLAIIEDLPEKIGRLETELGRRHGGPR